MIDTDKYEGHTPAPWDADDDGAGGNLHIDAEDVRLPINWADTQLMADAPLLLAEVKRKTALAEALWDFIEANIPHLIHQATDVWNNHNEEAIE